MTRLIFTNANLLDGENPAQAGRTVIVEGERIAAVQAGEFGSAQPGDHVVDLKGMTLMPGMVTAHFHAPYTDVGGPNSTIAGASQTMVAYEAAKNSRIALACGYTTVIGAGTFFDIDAELAEAIESGVIEGPRFIPSSRGLFPAEPASGTDNAGAASQAKNYDDDVSPSSAKNYAKNVSPSSGVGQSGSDFQLAVETPYAIHCVGPDAYAEGARVEVEGGARIVKIFATAGHGVIGHRDASEEEIRAACETAHALGARTRAHVAGRDNILKCIRAGVDIIDHADGMDDQCMELMIKNGTFVLPSLYMPYLYKNGVGADGPFAKNFDAADYEQMISALPKAVAAGIKLVPGDDYGACDLPHGQYSGELACYVAESGLSALEVIKWATKYGGEMSGIADLGTVAPGKLADLVIVDGDPSRDIALLNRPECIVAVIKGGRLASGRLPAENEVKTPVAA